MLSAVNKRSSVVKHQSKETFSALILRKINFEARLVNKAEAISDVDMFMCFIQTDVTYGDINCGR